MIQEIVWRRMLIAASGIVLLVVLLLFLVMYDVATDTSGVATPDPGVPFLWFIIFIHLLIGSALIWRVISSRRSQSGNNGYHVAAGLIIMLFGLLFLIAGLSFLGTSMSGTGIVLLFCSGSDIIAGMLSVIANILFRNKKPV